VRRGTFEPPLVDLFLGPDEWLGGLVVGSGGLEEIRPFPLLLVLFSLFRSRFLVDET
jgi:hypothetical protein